MSLSKFEQHTIFSVNLLGNMIECNRCLLEGSGGKHKKRVDRMDMASKFMFKNELVLAKNNKKPEQTNVQIAMLDFFNIKTYVLQMIDENILPKCQKNEFSRFGKTEPAKKVKNDQLTYWVNSGQVAYSVAMGVVQEIAKELRVIFPDECARGDIFIMLKGGVMFGQSLQNRIKLFGEDPDADKLIKLFKQGDNDTSVMINPEMKNANVIQTIVNDIVRRVLEEQALNFTFGSAKWSTIEASLDSKSQPIIGCFESRGDINIVDDGLFRKKLSFKKCVNRPVYVSSNKLEFSNNTSVVKFMLHRLKIAFLSCDNERLSAELLDVSINDIDSYDAIDIYKQYKECGIIPE
jgi:hypothetical protein